MPAMIRCIDHRATAARFLDGKDAIKDDQCSGRPIFSRTPAVIEKAVDGIIPRHELKHPKVRMICIV
ncbi:hypothetical protein TNCV_3212571 [Trichonephila clavipes]|nr:hypothetical protein TNCV_3212571 [Trichonephila clavipes]